MEQKISRKTWIGAGLLLAATVAALIATYPLTRDFMLYPESRRQLADAIANLGWWGPVVVFLMQVAQVIFAFLPGEPVEVLAGMVCGAWGGLVLCLAGTFVGGSVALFLVRRFGKPLVNLFFSDEQLYKYRFLQDTHRLEKVVFLVFFIPGTPKDILNYMAGLTRINALRFMMISTLARIPSVITSTMAGDALSEGNFGKMVGFFAVAAILACVGLRVHKGWAARMNRERDSEVTDEAAPDEAPSEAPENPA